MRLTLALAVLAPLALMAGCSLPGHVMDHDRQALVLDMQQWIAANTSYEIPAAPAIRLVRQDDLYRAVYGTVPAEGSVLGLIAVYNHKDNEIWVRPAFDFDRPADRVTVVHELVHVAQLGAGVVPCTADSEAEAYRLADRYAVEVLNDESLTFGRSAVLPGCRQ